MSEIQKFFEGQNLFVTGGTGYFGKILVEKLLRGLPGINKLYLLMRPKKGKEIQERLDKYFELEIFELLMKIKPELKKKIIPLNGDISKPNLGLSDEDRKKIINEVSTVIHAAATTKFDEPLEVAVEINVNSVLEIIKLCREMKKLKTAVYVSTAFIRRGLSVIEEVVYPMPMTYEDVNNTVNMLKRRNLSKEDEEQFTKILLGNFPNTYVFSKSIAEGLINEKAKDLPFCIYRFPIALSTYREPVSGWVDTMQGISLGFIGLGLGIIRVVLCPDSNATVHMVPSDFVCNALIASAWETGTAKKRVLDSGLPVFNFVIGKENVLTKGEFETFAFAARPHYPTNKSLYYPDAFKVRTRKGFAVLDFLFHMLPALFGDIILRILGKKPFLNKLYKKGSKLFKAGEFFMIEDWTIDNKNIELLWKNLSTVDRELFTFDMTKLDWNDVFIEYWKGILKHILKEDMSPEGRQKAIRRNFMLLVIHRTLQAAFLTFVIWLVWKLFCGRSFFS